MMNESMDDLYDMYKMNLIIIIIFQPTNDHLPPSVVPWLSWLHWHRVVTGSNPVEALNF